MLSNETARGAILGYYVLYRVKNTTSWTNQTVDGAGATSLSVGPLNEYTTYEFLLRIIGFFCYNYDGLYDLRQSLFAVCPTV